MGVFVAGFEGDVVEPDVWLPPRPQEQFSISARIQEACDRGQRELYASNIQKGIAKLPLFIMERVLERIFERPQTE